MCVESLVLVVAGYLDDSIVLEGQALGLAEHSGIWIIVIGDFLILFLLSIAFRLLLVGPRRFPVASNSVSKRYIRYSFFLLRRSLSLQRRDRQIWLLVTLVGFFFWINNAVQTTDAIRFYGRELYDSSTYIYGYIAMRLVLATSWIVFLPYLCFASLCTASSLYKIAKSCRNHGLFAFRFQHPDGCGGFSYLGQLNVIFVVGILIVYVELTVVTLTHQILNPGLVSGFVIATIAFLFGSYMMLIPVQRFLLEEKHRHELRKYRLAQRKKPPLHYYYFFHDVTFNAYKRSQLFVVYAMRIIPLVTAAHRTFISLYV